MRLYDFGIQDIRAENQLIKSKKKAAKATDNKFSY